MTKAKRYVLGMVVCAGLIVTGAAAQVGDVVDQVSVISDSSSGADITHVMPGAVTRVTVVSPYHYYRVPMDGVEAFPLAGDDSAIVPEVGSSGEVMIVDGPRVVNDSTWSVTVQMPQQSGNWIASFRTIGQEYELHGRKYARRPRTVQLRLSTKAPIEEYLKGL